MSRHYTVKSFFRNMPNAQLARYFHKKNALLHVSFATMKEGNPDPLFAQWMEIPDTQRNEMEADFREIFALSCQKGFLAILDEARCRLCKDPNGLNRFVEELSALTNHYERAMFTFLKASDFWKGATRFFHADSLTYWRKRKNLPHQPVSVDTDSISELSKQISDYFHNKEGRGKNCVVETYERLGRTYFFCYPEDHSQNSIEWVDGKFDPRPHNPAFEVVYVYSQKEGSLDLNFRGAQTAAKALQGIFASVILKLGAHPNGGADERVYDLNPLRQKNFAFSYDPCSGIESVVVKRLRLTSRAGKGERITLEADASQGPGAIHKLLEKISKTEPLKQYDVTQVELAASVEVDKYKPLKRVTIRISHPNFCSLKYEGIDLELRKMLGASGIELKEPEPETAEAAEA